MLLLILSGSGLLEHVPAEYVIISNLRPPSTDLSVINLHFRLALLGSFLAEVRNCLQSPTNPPQSHSSNRPRHGAGYSFRTNQYGLAADNVVAYNVVLPDGTPVTATKDKCEELFWALKVSSTTGSPKPNCCLTTIGKTGWRQQLRTSLILPGLHEQNGAH